MKNSVLKQRIITGLALIFIAIVVLFFLPLNWFMIVTAGVTLLAAWEWGCLSGLTTKLAKIFYIVFMLLAMVAAIFLPLMPVLIVTFIWWLCALFLVLRFPNAKSLWSTKWARIIIGFIVLVPCWLALSVLRASEHGALVLLFLFCLVWAADTGAYFSGRWWGKHKLLPMVSPGKTWQGFFGGLLLSVLVAVFGAALLQIDFPNWVLVLAVVVLLNIFSVVGDLFESMVKRYCQVKDSSSILPGHGGILDRMDSLTAAAPIFLLGFMLHLFY